MRAMAGFDALRAHSRITWIEQAQGWIAAPDDIVNVLANEGFEECKRETTTSRRDRQPAGGLWQGVNTLTGSVASAIWVTRPVWQDAVVFIEVDGESLALRARPITSGQPRRSLGGPEARRSNGTP